MLDKLVKEYMTGENALRLMIDNAKYIFTAIIFAADGADGKIVPYAYAVIAKDRDDAERKAVEHGIRIYGSETLTGVVIRETLT